MLKVIYNETTQISKCITFDFPIPRVGETMAFEKRVLEVVGVHYGLNLDVETCFVEIKVKNK